MSRLADVFLARADEWRKNKRYVEYYETKPLSDYNYQSIPGAQPNPSLKIPAETAELTREGWRACSAMVFVAPPNSP